MKTRSKDFLCGVLAMLLVVITAGCDGILGIEGFEAGCVDGARRCADNNTPEVCNASGTWESQGPCIAQTCSGGICIGECGPGQADCNGKTTKICDDQGRWQSGLECQYACSKGNCDCDPGQTRCVGNALETCGIDRQWPMGTECIDKTCIGDSATMIAECKGECAPGKRCLGNTPQVCDAMGNWEDQIPCNTNEQCTGGVCACGNGDVRCYGNTLQICTDSSWVNKLGGTCENQACDLISQSCIGVCAPKLKQCDVDGKTPQTCSELGEWVNEAACSFGCADGKCVECANGTSQCAGQQPQTCLNGIWQDNGSACDEQTCIDGVCIGDCAPGKRCLGNTPQTCNAAGEWEGSTPCATGQTCAAGICNCSAGDRRCFENRPQVCNASNQWVDDGQPCLAQACDPDTTACIGLCEPEEKRCLNANSLQRCDETGQWETLSLCAIGCVASECAACSANQRRCIGNSVQTCGLDGQWQDDENCVGKTCLDGICQGQCVIGSKRCAGSWPQVCSYFGVWVTAGAPCEGTESCYQGQCASSCTVGTTRCVGDNPQTCGSGGTWQSAGSACGDCITCNPDTGTCATAPAPTTVCVEPTTIDTGWYHACALLPNQRIKCWGDNADGQLGLGHTKERGDQFGEMGPNLPFVDLGAGVTAIDLSVDGFHSCALLMGGNIKCWGYNYYGQLGQGDSFNRGEQPIQMGDNLFPVDLGFGVTATAVSTGGFHTCALLSDGNVKCWGRNDYGQLGLGDPFYRGDNPNEMGQNLFPVDLGPGAVAIAITAGGYHTCALLANGNVKCWGRNTDGQLGLGDTSSRGDFPGEMGGALVPVNLGTGLSATAISAGETHTCALLSNSRVKCWGSNQYGKLGLGDLADRGDQQGEMGDSLLPVELGTGLVVTSISAGGPFTCARFSNGQAKCWGRNRYGQLGFEDQLDRGDQAGEMGSALLPINLGTSVLVNRIHPGLRHTCALLIGGSVKCWGNNTYGQLGLFDTMDRGDDLHEMGDNLPIVDL